MPAFRPVDVPASSTWVVAPVSGGGPAETASLGRRLLSPGRASSIRQRHEHRRQCALAWDRSYLRARRDRRPRARRRDGCGIRARRRRGRARSRNQVPARHAEDRRRIGRRELAGRWRRGGGAGGRGVLPPAPPRLARATASMPAAWSVTWYASTVLAAVLTGNAYPSEWYRRVRAAGWSTVGRNAALRIRSA